MSAKGEREKEHKELSLKFSYPEKGLVTVLRDGKDWLCLESSTAADDVLLTLVNRVQETEARVAELEEALKFYADYARWTEIISCGNIFDEQDGDPVDAFNRDQDEPWMKARQALKGGKDE